MKNFYIQLPKWKNKGEELTAAVSFDVRMLFSDGFGFQRNKDIVQLIMQSRIRSRLIQGVRNLCFEYVACTQVCCAGWDIGGNGNRHPPAHFTHGYAKGLKTWRRETNGHRLSQEPNDRTRTSRYGMGTERWRRISDNVSRYQPPDRLSPSVSFLPTHLSHQRLSSVHD